MMEHLGGDRDAEFCHKVQRVCAAAFPKAHTVRKDGRVPWMS